MTLNLSVKASTAIMYETVYHGNCDFRVAVCSSNLCLPFLLVCSVVSIKSKTLVGHGGTAWLLLNKHIIMAAKCNKLRSR